MSLHESGEMYLETIYILSQQLSAVRSIDVGEYMGFSKPSVSRAVNLLKNENYITIDRDGSLHLTESGREIAERIYDSHKLLTKLLVTLGVNEETAQEDACKMEHHISDETFYAIKNYLNRMNIGTE